MNEMPLVSVIMPLFNSERYVSEAIKSIQIQSFENWELIIVDDESSDRSLEIATKFQSAKIKIYSKANGGAAAARNYGYRLAKGELVKFFDADDIINPVMLESQVALALNNPDCIISSKWGRFYRNDLKTFRFYPESCWKDLSPIEWICNSWYKGTSMTQPGIFLIPRGLIETNGLWNESLTLIDDLEFFTKNILGSNKVVFCPSSILYYRSGNSNNLSGQKSRKAMESYFRSLELSTGYLLNKTTAELAKLSAANVWQSFLFECYPQHPDLRKKAEHYLSRLPKADLTYSTNYVHNLIISTFGWKFFKLIQRLKRKI